MPLGQRVRRDLARIGINGHVQLEPAPAGPAVLGRIPLALTEQLEAGAVQHEMQRAGHGAAARLPAGERFVPAG